LDWSMAAAAAVLVAAGLSAIASFGGEGVASSYAWRQLAWVGVSALAFLLLAASDAKLLRRSAAVVWIYGLSVALLLGLFAAGTVAKGAESWFRLGAVGFQPVEFAKLALILVLAKYFSRRHVEIRAVRHTFVSGAYALGIFALTLMQPDFGGALVVFLVWLGVALASGLPRGHLLALLLAGALAFGALWSWGFDGYQKARILTFVDSTRDVRGAGYNAIQAQVAVGSGQVWGKGLGYGTQSRLRYLPEYHTDFVFAAFAEEWGLAGSLVLLLAYGVLIWRVLAAAYRGATNFEVLLCVGVAVYLLAHGTIAVGMNLGVLPVTGIPLPLVSYGGTSLLVTAAMLGIVTATRGYARATHRSATQHEIPGLTG
ncbi:MAG TPA: FtsW/RodA/SpoVE family cell cycle protein, partial [Candidatus Paceibacterota bacterium]